VQRRHVSSLNSTRCLSRTQASSSSSSSFNFLYSNTGRPMSSSNSTSKLEMSYKLRVKPLRYVQPPKSRTVSSYMPLFVAPQTRSSNVVRSIHTIFRRSTNTLEECGSLHTYHFLLRHKHTRQMWFASYTPFFVAPKTRSRNVVRFIHATFCRATITPVECSSPHTRHFLSRHKHARGCSSLHIRHLSSRHIHDRGM